MTSTQKDFRKNNASVVNDDATNCFALWKALPKQVNSLIRNMSDSVSDILTRFMKKVLHNVEKFPRLLKCL